MFPLLLQAKESTANCPEEVALTPSGSLLWQPGIHQLECMGAGSISAPKWSSLWFVD